MKIFLSDLKTGFRNTLFIAKGGSTKTNKCIMMKIDLLTLLKRGKYLSNLLKI